MYLIFDTETTGLPQNFNAPITDSNNWPRMVQIAWQLHDDEGKLIENQDYIIKPEGYDIPFNATRIHGISTKMAKEEGKDLAWVLEEFKKALEKTKVGVGHNIDFDYKIVGAEFFRKELYHFWSIPKNLFCIRFVFFFYIIIYVYISPFIFNHGIFSYSHEK